VYSNGAFDILNGITPFVIRLLSVNRLNDKTGRAGGRFLDFFLVSSRKQIERYGFKAEGLIKKSKKIGVDL
jgi:hypothetical protein